MQKNIQRNPRTFTNWLNQYYVWVISSLLFFFLLVAFLAPIFMKIGLVQPAKFIYWVYEAFCHQLTFRSWFLFGQQTFYPRELAKVENIISYEKVTGDFHLDLKFAREFLGNDDLGYKVALCQRDVAIYGSLFLCGFIFQLSGKKIDHLPWYLWIILGILPVGVDGVTQFGGLGINFLAWLPIRESTPILRTITGILFGITTGLFLFPMVEENMSQSIRRE
jgi:uncharacterized membrane protein